MPRLNPSLANARLRLGKLLALRRFPAQEERQFLQFYTEKTYPKARLGIVAGFFAWVSFCLWDSLAFPHRLPELAAIRLGLISPLLACLACFCVCQPKRFKAGMQGWLAATLAAVALGLFLMMAIAGQQDTGRAFQQFWPAFAGLLLFLYAFIGLRPLPAAALGLASFALVWTAGSRPGVEAAALGAALLQLAILNAIGLIVCARMEIQARTLFRLRQHHRRLARAAREERQNVQDARDETLLENARAEAALMLARAEREKLALAIAEKERFLSAAYHDLQQPLSTIGLYVRHVKTTLDHVPGVAVQFELEIIERAGQDIAQMFKGVRDAWEVGRTQPNLAAVDINAILDDIEPEARQAASRKGLTFRVHRSRHSAAWGHTDRLLLKRALSNLVGNAIKYTEHGGVLVGIANLGKSIRLDVWDTGIGIPEEFQAHIFKEYFQVGAGIGQRKRRGLGLGLAIVRRIEENLPGHRLSFASKPGRGSRFSFNVPAAPAPTMPPCPCQPSPANRCLEGKYIVLVEDERENLDGMMRVLAEVGGIVEGVDSAQAARRLFADRDRCPDILVADFHLRQGQTGLDAVTALRERFEWAAEVPVLFVTGDLDLPRKLAGFKGVHGIHHKPIDADVLLAQLRDLLKPPMA